MATKKRQFDHLAPSNIFRFVPYKKDYIVCSCTMFRFLRFSEPNDSKGENIKVEVMVTKTGLGCGDC